MATEDTRERPVPPTGPETVRTNVPVEPELREWGKRQPGGLSERVRRLLREAKVRQEAGKGGSAE